MTTVEESVQRSEIGTDYLRLIKEVEELYYHEADLLDFRRYSEWLDLLTEDIRYFMPIARNVRYGDWEREYSKEGEDVAWFDEGKEILATRVRQIETGIHWAEEPSSRQSHIITNVRILDDVADLSNPQEISTSSRFLAYRQRLSYETDLLIGKRMDTLRKVEGKWKIARRRLLLDQTVLLEKNLTMFF